MQPLAAHLGSKKKENLRSLRSKTVNNQGKTTKAKQVEVIALDLANKLNGHTHYNFILKAVWHVPERELRRIADEAVRRTPTPLWYFIGCVKPLLKATLNGQ